MNIEKTLDNLIRTYVKKKYKTCYICGSSENLQVGHAWSRKYYVSRWNLKVIRAECRDCNYYLDQNNIKFRHLLEKEYGKKQYKELKKKMKEQNTNTIEIKKALLELAEAFGEIGELALKERCLKLFENFVSTH